MLTPTNALLRHHDVRQELVKLVVRACCEWDDYSSSDGEAGVDSQTKDATASWTNLKLKEDALQELQQYASSSSWPLSLKAIQARSLRITFSNTLQADVQDLRVSATWLQTSNQQEQPRSTESSGETFAHRLARFVLDKQDDQLHGVLRLISIFASWAVHQQAAAALASLFQQQLRQSDCIFEHATIDIGLEQQSIHAVTAVLEHARLSCEQSQTELSNNEATRTLHLSGLKLRVLRSGQASPNASPPDPSLDTLSETLKQLRLDTGIVDDENKSQSTQKHLNSTDIQLHGSPISITIRPSSRDLAVMHTHFETERLLLQLSAQQFDCLIALYEVLEPSLFSISDGCQNSYQGQFDVIEIHLSHQFESSTENQVTPMHPSSPPHSPESASKGKRTDLHLCFTFRDVRVHPSSLSINCFAAFEHDEDGSHRCIMTTPADIATTLSLFEQSSPPFNPENSIKELSTPILEASWDQQKIEISLHHPIHLFLDLGHYSFFKAFFDCLGVESESTKEVESTPVDVPSISRLLGRRRFLLIAPAIEAIAAVSCDETEEIIPLLQAMRIVKVSFARPRVQGTRSSVTLESTKASLTLNSSVVSLQEASTETFVTTQGDQDTDLTSDEQQPFLSFRRQNLTASAPWAVDVGLPFARLHIDQSVVDDLSQFAERATQEIPIYTKVDLSLRVTDFEGKVEGQSCDSQDSSPPVILAQMEEGGVTGQFSIAPVDLSSTPD